MIIKDRIEKGQCLWWGAHAGGFPCFITDLRYIDGKTLLRLFTCDNCNEGGWLDAGDDSVARSLYPCDLQRAKEYVFKKHSDYLKNKDDLGVKERVFIEAGLEKAINFIKDRLRRGQERIVLANYASPEGSRFKQ
jgi:hypothetical protein